jgi:hypothetical protein
MKTTQSDLIEISRWLKVAALLVLILYPIWAVCFLINWFMLGHPLRSRNFGGWAFMPFIIVGVPVLA